MAEDLMEFLFFRKLPPEIRLKIWKAALSVGSVISISYSESKKGLYHFTGSTSHTISQVNHEAQTETLKYKLQFPGSPYNNSLSVGPVQHVQTVFTNLANDVPWLRVNRLDFLRLLHWMGTSQPKMSVNSQRRVAVNWTVIAWMVIDIEDNAVSNMLDFMRCCKQAGISELLLIFSNRGENTINYTKETVFYPAFRPPRSFLQWRTTITASSPELSLWSTMCKRIMLNAMNYPTDRTRNYCLCDTWAVDCEKIEERIGDFFRLICAKQSEGIEELKAAGLTGDLLKRGMTEPSLIEIGELAVPRFKLRRVLCGDQDMHLVEAGRVENLEAVFDR